MDRWASSFLLRFHPLHVLNALLIVVVVSLLARRPTETVCLGATADTLGRPHAQVETGDVVHSATSVPSAAASADGSSGYSQPATARHAWFPRAASSDFRALPLATGTLLRREPPAGKWVVVTTINRPTPTIARLAALPGWRTVVVGDTKTPADWAYPNVTFLDLAEQAALGFSVTPLLRTRSYQRKNVGYLYAVLHGATIIYETDDDNALTVPDVPLVDTAGGPGRGAGAVLEYVAALSPLTINHHAHFGQPATWPRGYPLESIGEPHLVRVRAAPVTPAVQQGLANGDPDMDAIFRLTRKPASERIDFAFSPGAAPVALPFGSFAPYNAQNTVFTYEGLWATVLPQSVTFRVCDIWRAFFTQRLMWGVGAQLTFVAPYVYQLRNSHSYHEDYLSEAQIYDQVSDLLSWLRAWTCPADETRVAGRTLPACGVALARDMARAGFWGAADAELIRHFFHDLARAGYVFPAWIENIDDIDYTDSPAIKAGGNATSGNDRVEVSLQQRFVRACSTSDACPKWGETRAERLVSLPSATLYGTCPADGLPKSAVADVEDLTDRNS